MEYHGRRSRRGRGHNYAVPSHSYTPPHAAKPWTFLSGFYSFFIMTSLTTLIYMMLDYHCTACATRCDFNNITKNLDYIATNLSIVKSNYDHLEIKISNFSQEIPKLEEQISLLETLISSLDKQEKQLGWDPKKHTPLPNVDVILTKPHVRTCKPKSKKQARRDRAKPVAVTDK